MLHIVYKPDAIVSEPGGPLCPRAREGCARLRGSPFPKQALDSENGTGRNAHLRVDSVTATDQEPMLSLDFHFEASSPEMPSQSEGHAGFRYTGCSLR
jgi:hypothetical protein